MEKYIQLKGSDEAISEQLQKQMGLSRTEALRIFYYLANNDDILDNDECVTSQHGMGGVSGVMSPNGKYYLNVKITTIAICALLLDIKLTDGIIGMVLPLVGITSRIVFYKLSEKEGQKCILKEILRSKNKTGNKYMLEKFGAECVNNDLADCKYRQGTECSCASVQVEEILTTLENENVLRRDEGGGFRYCW